MRKNFGFLTLTAMMVIALLFGIQSPSQATLGLLLNDPSTGPFDVNIIDGSPQDANPLPNAITYVGTFGNWTLNVTTGIENIGGCLLDLNSINATSAAGGQLAIGLFDAALHPTGPFIVEAGGTTGGTVNFSVFQDGGGALASLGPFSGGAFSGETAGQFNGLYNLTVKAIIQHTGAGVTSFDVCVTPVPLPGAVLLFGAGVVRLVAYARRRQD
jgi:hypothetical protein